MKEKTLYFYDTNEDQPADLIVVDKKPRKKKQKDIFGKYTFESVGFEVDATIPKKCPLCNTINNAIMINGFGVRTPDIKRQFAMLHLTFICQSCMKGYLVSGELRRKSSRFKFENFYSGPVVPFKRKFDKILTQISKDFEIIFNEAYASEQFELFHVCGVAYRKAIEFLINDFLKVMYKDDEKVIDMLNTPATRLTTKIELLNNKKIISLARACTYLGNDETHPVRKHTDKDLSDLKVFIDTLINFISDEACVLFAEKFIDESN